METSREKQRSIMLAAQCQAISANYFNNNVLKEETDGYVDNMKNY
jgi:hypothetical protein